MSLEKLETETDKLVALCHELKKENEILRGSLGIAVGRKDHSRDSQFGLLVSIVADAYKVRPEMITSRVRRHVYTTPRHVVAALWAERNSMADVAARLSWNSHVNVDYAIKKVGKMLLDPLETERIYGIISRVKKEMPWLLMKE
jgi:chromosomal replication initiation ATPase DnaA